VSQQELVRIVAQGESLVVSRTATGRGAWLCSGSAECLDLAVRRNAFSRALRVPIATSHAATLLTELPAS
jgi:predicted RNA-binding protein YlxR (DUF448 family)